MTTTAEFDGSVDRTVLALAVTAVLPGSAAYVLVPDAGDVVYYGLMAIGVLALGGIHAKRHLE